MPVSARLVRRLAFSLAVALPALSGASPPPEPLVDAAREKGLSRSPKWHALLHYRPNLILPGVTSEIDSPDFFLSDTGKTSPEAELEATIRALFTEPPSSPDGRRPLCRFVARYEWLRRELAPVPERSSLPPCPAFREWLSALDPRGVTLIFPTAYLNNPSSMFGHTLLRVDAQGQGPETRLLAYAVNYAAATGDDGGIPFAVKGLTGAYPGVFSIEPYYLTVRRYSDMENRDVWEYELDLNPCEIEFMLMHLWELRAAHFNYFFFDENCSYHLLGLLDAARPGLGLKRRFRRWVIPSETVRAVVEEAGLVRGVTYRPSRRAVLEYRMDRLEKEERAEVRRLVRWAVESGAPPADTPPSMDRARLLEIGYELLNYKAVTGQIEKERAARAGHRLLAARSALDPLPAEDVGAPEPAVRPDQGHRPGRLSLSFGLSEGRWFEEAGIRPAYHDLLDPPGGYVSGAQIRFLDLALRHYPDSNTLRLEEAAGVDIFSITPFTHLKRPVSWKLHAGLLRRHRTARDNPLVVHLNGGAGAAWRPIPPLTVYAMMEGTLDFGGGLERTHSAGFGSCAGLLADLSRLGCIEATAGWTRFLLGERHTRRVIALAHRIPVSRGSALEIRAGRLREFGRGWGLFALTWHRYF